MSRSARVHPLLLLLFSVFLFYWDSLFLSLVAGDTSYTQLKQDPDTPKNTRAGKLAVQLRGQHETVATGWACQAATLARPLLCSAAQLCSLSPLAQWGQVHGTRPCERWRRRRWWWRENDEEFIARARRAHTIKLRSSKFIIRLAIKNNIFVCSFHET